MTERERLIELISDAQYLGGLEEKIADHLLFNGVIVPPCDIGDEIYCVAGKDMIYKTICYAFSRDAFDNLTIIDEFNGYHLAKQVFLTREEAEAVLKEREEKWELS